MAENGTWNVTWGRCEQCGKPKGPYQRFCGAGCTARSEAHEEPNYKEIAALYEIDAYKERERANTLEKALVTALAQRDAYRETCKNAQERGTVKHEQVVRARGLLREARRTLDLVYPLAKQTPGISVGLLVDDIDAELARSID